MNLFILHALEIAAIEIGCFILNASFLDTVSTAGHVIGDDSQNCPARLPLH